MTSYDGWHAELYDLFYKDKPYRDEAIFVHQLLQEFRTGDMLRVLDLACGTGSHLIELAKTGYAVTGVDHSASMLAQARAKFEAAGLAAPLHCADMPSFRLPDANFDAVVCLFDSVGYVVTNAALGATFANVWRHLRPDGLFVLEFWHAAAMFRHYDPVRVLRWTLGDREVLRISETKLDHASQTATVQYSIYELSRNGTYRRLEEQQTNRYFPVQEMNYWLCSNGFKVLGNYAGFSREAAISDLTWHIVTVARKAGSDRIVGDP